MAWIRSNENMRSGSRSNRIRLASSSSKKHPSPRAPKSKRGSRCERLLPLEKQKLSNHKDDGAFIRRPYQKDVLPIMGDMAIADVGKAHVVAHGVAHDHRRPITPATTASLISTGACVSMLSNELKQWWLFSGHDYHFLCHQHFRLPTEIQ